MPSTNLFNNQLMQMPGQGMSSGQGRGRPTGSGTPNSTLNQGGNAQQQIASQGNAQPGQLIGSLPVSGLPGSVAGQVQPSPVAGQKGFGNTPVSSHSTGNQQAIKLASWLGWLSGMVKV